MNTVPIYDANDNIIGYKQIPVNSSVSTSAPRTKVSSSKRFPRKSWTPENDNFIIREYSEGHRIKEIARLINRTEDAVNARICILRKSGRVKNYQSPVYRKLQALSH